MAALLTYKFSNDYKMTKWSFQRPWIPTEWYIRLSCWLKVTWYTAFLVNMLLVGLNNIIIIIIIIITETFVINKYIWLKFDYAFTFYRLYIGDLHTSAWERRWLHLMCYNLIIAKKTIVTVLRQLQLPFPIAILDFNGRLQHILTRCRAEGFQLIFYESQSETLVGENRL